MDRVYDGNIGMRVDRNLERVTASCHRNHERKWPSVDVPIWCSSQLGSLCHIFRGGTRQLAIHFYANCLLSDIDSLDPRACSNPPRHLVSLCPHRSLVYPRWGTTNKIDRAKAKEVAIRESPTRLSHR